MYMYIYIYICIYIYVHICRSLASSLMHSRESASEASECNIYTVYIRRSHGKMGNLRNTMRW